jgi:hypothetical protein
MRRVRVVVGAVVVALVALTGCAADPSATGSGPPPGAESAESAEPSADAPPGPTTIPAGMGAPEGDGVFPRTMTHFGGTTTIEAAPQRVVVIATGQTDATLTLGVVPVGVAYGDDADLVPRYLRDAYPQYADQLAAITSVGARQNPNLESIAALRPDLVLANSAAAQDIYPALSRIAPTVLVEGTGVNWKQDFLMLADSLGMEGTAPGTGPSRSSASPPTAPASSGRRRSPGSSPGTPGSPGHRPSGSPRPRRTCRGRSCGSPTATGSSTPCRARPRRPRRGGPYPSRARCGSRSRPSPPDAPFSSRTTPGTSTPVRPRRESCWPGWRAPSPDPGAASGGSPPESKICSSHG